MIPLERGRQLKALADHDGVGVTELIERVIEDGIQRGAIPDEIPGFIITLLENSEPPAWRFESGTFWMPRLEEDGMRLLAEGFERATQPGFHGCSVSCGPDEVRILRIGKGVLLLGAEADFIVHKRTMTQEWRGI